MYNQEIKERFLEQNKNKKNPLIRFGKAEDFYKLDVCQMTRTQTIEAVGMVSGCELSTVDTLVSCLKAYAKWCFNNGLFPDAPYGVMGIMPADIRPYKAIRDLVFISEDELRETIQKYIPIEDGYIEVIACFFSWMGIQDLLAIHDSDVFIEGRKIMCNGSVIVDGFSDYLAGFLERYKKISVSSRDNGTTTYPVIKDRSFDTFIKRFCPPTSPKLGKELEITVIQSAIGELNNKYIDDGGAPRFTQRNIMRSGSLRRLYVAEQNGLDVFDKANREIVEGFFFEGKYRSITWLYERYKAAFNL